MFRLSRSWLNAAGAAAWVFAGAALAQESGFVTRERTIVPPKCLTGTDRSSTCSPQDHQAWLTDIRAWRDQRRIYIGYSGKRYEEPKTAWARSAYVETQVGVEDRYLYDPETRRYTVDRYLDDLFRRFGGVDAVLVWPFYPNSGIDARNHVDMMASMPGGLAGVRQMVADFHRRGVKVLFPTMMWDQGTRPPASPWPDQLADVLKAVDADGVNGDTMAGVPQAFSRAADDARHPLVFEPEGPFDDTLLENNLMGWAYYYFTADWAPSPPSFAPKVDRFRWLKRRHMVHVNERWSHDRSDNLQYAFFQGAGYEPWENVWGIWNGMTARDSALTRRFGTLSRALAPYLQSEDWEPYAPMLQAGVFASRWTLGEDRLWTIVNRNDYAVSGAEIRLPATAGLRYYDLYHGVELTPEHDGMQDVLSFDVEGRGLGAVLAAPGPAGKAMTALMGQMRALAAVRLATLDDQWRPLPQTLLPIAKTAPYAATPAGMIDVPATKLDFAVTGREIEEDKGYVDVQYPWEDRPRRFHRQTIPIDRFFIDRFPVTNRAFESFLDQAAYSPKDQQNFLKDWRGRAYPDKWGGKPVTWVSIEDARAYCAWSGKRLPHEWEWQYAAQGVDGRAYPWGGAWRDDAAPTPDKSRSPRAPDDVDAHPAGASAFGVRDLVGNVWQWTDEYRDEHTRSAVLRGGSYYQPQGSSWYFPQAYRNDQHNKLLLMAPSKDRSAMIGFRCAADAAS